MEIYPWALVSAENIVITVQMASEEWINANPAAPPTAWRMSPDPSSPGYAGIGFTWDEETGWFIPPSPGEGWRFDRETWHWVLDTPPNE